jgi:hypothetical protein
MPVLEKLVAKYIENEVNEGSIPVVYGKIHVFDRSEKSKSSLVKMKVKKNKRFDHLDHYPMEPFYKLTSLTHGKSV